MKLPVKLTDAIATSLILPAGKADHIVWDILVPRFGVRMRESGTRTWILKYKLTLAGRKAIERTVTIGEVGAMTAAVARKQAEQLRAKVRLGQDPAADKMEAKTKATELRIGERINEYLPTRECEMRLRAYKEVKRHLKIYAVPLHGLAPHALDNDPEPVKVLFNTISKERGKTAANHLKSSLSKFFKWAIDESVMKSNPAAGIKKHKAGKRKRVLSDDELRLVWQCLPEAGDDYGDIVRLLMLTGQRRVEIGDLAWSEMPPKGNHAFTAIELPEDRTKNKEPHTVPLSDEARAIIAKREHLADRDFVFGSGEGGFSGWSNCKERLDTAITEKNGKAIKPWVLHDLRRTLATRWAAKPMSIHPWIVEAHLNHVSGHKEGVAGIYNLETYVEERAAAMAAWGKHLMAIVEPRVEDVAAAA
jgi:integrase